MGGGCNDIFCVKGGVLRVTMGNEILMFKTGCGWIYGIIDAIDGLISWEFIKVHTCSN